jgi:hypothetical protein
MPRISPLLNAIRQVKNINPQIIIIKKSKTNFIENATFNSEVKSYIKPKITPRSKKTNRFSAMKKPS